MTRTVVTTHGRRLALSNLEKDLYPSSGFTKAAVLEYYRRIAPYLLPHTRDRALTLKRYPDGAEQEFFFEKRCPAHRPPWVGTADLERAGGDRMTVCLLNDEETLLWVGNLASLELHIPLARAYSPDTPDAVVFDLDPGEGVDLVACGRVALTLRDLLAHAGFASVAKTSGRKGLHVYVPLNTGSATFEDTKIFSRSVAGILQKHHPDVVTAKVAKQERPGRVFINWEQNDAKRTMVSVYSLRAGALPTVSFPLAWRELEAAVAGNDTAALVIGPEEAVRRAEADGDRFQDMLTRQQRLPHA